MTAKAVGLKADTDQLTIGALLRKLRKEAGRSQLEQAELLCELSGRNTLTRIDVARWERQKRIPARYWQQYIADSFGIPVDEVRAAANASRNQRRLAKAVTQAVGLESATGQGALLRQRRIEAGRTQQEQADILSELSGRTVTHADVSRWETERQLMRKTWQQRYADSFGIPVDEIRRAVAVSKTRRYIEELKNASHG